MKKTYSDAATQLYAKGFLPIPLTPRKKYPSMHGWQKCTEIIQPWPHNHGVGLLCGESVTGIDLDIYDTGMIAELLKCFDGIDILTRVGQPPKILIPVACPEVKSKIISDQWADQDGTVNRIEILSKGQQFVAFGIHPATGKPYQWSCDLLTHSLPVIPLSMIERIFARFYELAIRAGWKNITIKPEKYTVRKKDGNGNKPGDLYNRAVLITDVLLEYGWKCYRGKHWTRPGKAKGVSGAVMENGNFWCFTSSTCLEPDRSYDSFGLMAMYEFSGDFSAAARAVREVV